MVPDGGRARSRRGVFSHTRGGPRSGPLLVSAQSSSSQPQSGLPGPAKSESPGLRRPIRKDFAGVRAWARARADADHWDLRESEVKNPQAQAQVIWLSKERVRVALVRDMAVGEALEAVGGASVLVVRTTLAAADTSVVGDLCARELWLPADSGLLDAEFDAIVEQTKLDHARDVHEHLLRVSLALNAEREPEAILSSMLLEARFITKSDAGSIYVVEANAEGRDVLRFRCAQNDSIELDFRAATLDLDDQSIAGNCALTGTCSRIRNARIAPEDDDDRGASGHDHRFDQSSGYQTVSMLTVPMRMHSGTVIGVMQLINARHGTEPLRSARDFAENVHGFDSEDEAVCMAVAAQGAVALENARLYNEVEASLRGFVEASVMAIEARDPSTSGHSRRVAQQCMILAEACQNLVHPTLGRLGFSREQLDELEYAALLHDFGKVGVRDAVLTKAKKLQQERLDLLAERHRHLRNAVMGGAVLQVGSTDGSPLVGDEALARVEKAWKVVLEANEPTVLAERVSKDLDWVGQLQLLALDGAPLRLVDSNDLEALRIERGSLTASERRAIQRHVVCSREFLEKIPWRRTLRRVPEIAGKHHEYLDGTGYPDGVSASEIPVQSRIMTICDIYDALTANDRPYKRAVPVRKALEIIGSEARQGRVDAAVFDVFSERVRQLDWGRC